MRCDCLNVLYLEGAQMVRIEFLTVAAKSIGGEGVKSLAAIAC